MTQRVSPLETRYYHVPPEDKTLQQCFSHGRDHKVYGWMKQIDPRWTDEQIQAYKNGYDGKSW